MVIYINHRKVYFIHANTHTCARGIYVTYAVVDKVGDVPIVGCVYSVLIVHIVQVVTADGGHRVAGGGDLNAATDRGNSRSGHNKRDI